MSHDCPAKLAKGSECTVDLTFTPDKAIYDANSSSLDITADIIIAYEGGDAISYGVPLISQTMIQTAGTMNDLPQLVFNDFDSSTSGSTVGAQGSSSFYDVVVKNVGANKETDFDLAMTNTTEFFIVDDAGLVNIDGHPNCAHIDSAVGDYFQVILVLIEFALFLQQQEILIAI